MLQKIPPRERKEKPKRGGGNNSEPKIVKGKTLKKLNHEIQNPGGAASISKATVKKRFTTARNQKGKSSRA